MKKIYILGNKLDPRDKKALLLLPTLKKQFPEIEFVHFDPTEEITDRLRMNLTIIDTVAGIKKVTIYKTLKNFERAGGLSVHDFDLYFFLGLLQKLNKLKKITIIGIPQNARISDLKKEIVETLKETLV